MFRSILLYINTHIIVSTYIHNYIITVSTVSWLEQNMDMYREHSVETLHCQPNIRDTLSDETHRCVFLCHLKN